MLQDTRDPAAASRSLPRIGAELATAIGLCESCADSGLQIMEELRGAIEEVRHARMLPSRITDDVGRDSPSPCDACIRGHLP